MKTIWKIGSLPLLLAVMAGPAAAAPLLNSSEEVREIQPVGGSFASELAKQYRSFALFEADEMYDWPDADHFAEKSLEAHGGKVVQPENPENWNVDEAYMAELLSARGKLTQALDAGGRDKVPDAAALAQAKYDCWVEQQEEGHQPAHIAACRDEFRLALAGLEEALAPKVSAAPEMTAGEAVADTVVYFDWDEAGITSTAQVKIDRFVSEMKEMKDIILFVEGHADRSGPVDYNRTLSRSRAENVRAELVRQGMNVSKIDSIELTGRGESEPAVATPDGVKAEANRRVKITARGMVPKLVPAAQSVEQ